MPESLGDKQSRFFERAPKALANAGRPMKHGHYYLLPTACAMPFGIGVLGSDQINMLIILEKAREFADFICSDLTFRIGKGK
jgi:hypothetical protein